VVEHLCRHMEPGAALVVRSAHGACGFLYPVVDPEDVGRAGSRWWRCTTLTTTTRRGVVNSIIVVRKAANGEGKGGGGAAPVVSPPRKCCKMQTGAGAAGAPQLAAAEEGVGVSDTGRSSWSIVCSFWC
jgi:nicotianamine synthase